MKRVVTIITVILLVTVLCAAFAACGVKDKATDEGESGDASMALTDVVLRFVKAGYYIGDVEPVPEDEREESGMLWGIYASKGEEEIEAWLYETNKQATAESDDFFSHFGEKVDGGVCGLRDAWLYCGTEAALNVFLGQANERDTVPAAFVDAVERLLRAGYAFDIIDAEDAEEYSFLAYKEKGEVEDFLEGAFLPSEDKAIAFFDENRADMEETYAEWEAAGFPTIILKQEGRWVYAATEAALRVISK